MLCFSVGVVVSPCDTDVHGPCLVGSFFGVYMISRMLCVVEDQ
jgi:hypothetical protein